MAIKNPAAVRRLITAILLRLSADSGLFSFSIGAFSKTSNKDIPESKTQINGDVVIDIRNKDKVHISIEKIKHLGLVRAWNPPAVLLSGMKDKW